MRYNSKIKMFVDNVGLRMFVLFSSQGAQSAVTQRRLLRAVLVGVGCGVRLVVDTITVA